MKGKRVWAFCVVLLAGFSLSASGRILFISSYDVTWATVPLQIEGFLEGAGDDVPIDYEFMDTKKTSYGKAWEEYVSLLSLKLKERSPYDLVVASDDAALDLVETYRNTLFDGIPVVFLCIDDPDRVAKGNEDPLATGLGERINLPGCFSLAKAMIPHAKKVVFIVDDTIIGLADRRQVEDAIDTYQGYGMEFINSSLLTKEELAARLSSLSVDDINFCLAMGEGKGGVTYPTEERFALLEKYASAPLFRLSIAGVGVGPLVGGLVVDYGECGRIAGQYARQILEGAAPLSLPVQEVPPYHYLFDQKVLDRYKLSVPSFAKEADATILNAHVPFFQRHFKVVILVLSASLLLLASIVIAIILKDNRERKRTNGKLSKMVGELEDANSKLKRANQAESEFLSRMSHDIRTPMNGIMGLTHFALESDDVKEIHRYLKQLSASSTYLLGLLNDILTMSKIDEGKVTLKPQTVKSGVMLEAIISLVQAQAEEKGVSFVSKIQPLDDVPYLYVDTLRIQQVVVNILNNAVKYTPKGGTVTYECTHCIEGEIVRFRHVVSDTGVGMSKEFMKAMFDPFAQERNSLTQVNSSTGLGLSICKQLTSLLGGTISVESELGKGSCFTVVLPARMGTESQYGKEHITADRNGKFAILAGKRVLLVEDHPLNRMIAEKLLKQQGMLVECAENGQVGVDMYLRNPVFYYDAILMDIRMPVMDGLEATKIIRESDGLEDAKTIPIIAMTANALDDDVDSSHNAGMDAHLSKPIEVTKLFETLSRLIGRGER